MCERHFVSLAEVRQTFPSVFTHTPSQFCLFSHLSVSSRKIYSQRNTCPKNFMKVTLRLFFFSCPGLLQSLLSGFICSATWPRCPGCSILHVGPKVSAEVPKKNLSPQSSSHHHTPIYCTFWRTKLSLCILQNGMNMESVSRSEILAKCSMKSPLQRAEPAQTHACVPAQFPVVMKHGSLQIIRIHKVMGPPEMAVSCSSLLSAMCHIILGLEKNDCKSVSIID